MRALLLCGLLVGCDGAVRAVPGRALPPPTAGPDVRVYGYLPYWGDDLPSLPWDDLSDVALFTATALADGSLTDTSRWGDVASALRLAEPYGVRVHLCVASFDTPTLDALLSSGAARGRLVDALAAEVDRTGAHGINVDFEGVPAARRADMVSFIRALAARVPEVVIASPAVDWSDAWDYAALTEVSDLFIMGYDYHWRTSGTAGPVDPLYGGGPWSSISLDATVDDYLASADPARVILGLPLYGYRWPTADGSVAADALGSGTTVLYKDAPALFATHGRRYDATTHAPWAWDGEQQIWAPDEDSVTERVAYGLDRGLAGVGFWALHYDDDDPALWARLRALTTEGAAPPVDTDTPPGDAPDDTDAPGDSGVPWLPIANAGMPFLAYVGETVELSGEGSWGPGELKFQWTQVGGPPVQLDRPKRASPRFVVAEPGVHTFELVVRVGERVSEPARAIVVVTDPRVGRRYRGCETGGALGLGLLGGLLVRRRARLTS